MALKKYDKEATKEQNVEKVEEEQAPTVDEFEAQVIENEKEAEELNQIPLDELQTQTREELEKMRVEYFVKTKKEKRISTGFSIGLISIVVICFVLWFTLSAKFPPILYIVLGIMVVAVAGSFLLSRLLKKKLSGGADIYINGLFGKTNEYIFRDKEKFSQAEFKPTSQMKDELFIDARIYKNVKSTKSRNLISVKYKGETLGIADLAANVLVKNRTSPMFLGKYFDYSNSYNKDGKRILMQIKGGNLSRPVDDVDDLELVESTKTYNIYSNDHEWRKTLTSKAIKDICKLKVDKTLIDVIVAINPGKTNIGIDYTDDFINIPVDTEVNFNNIKRAESDINKVLTILDDIK